MVTPPSYKSSNRLVMDAATTATLLDNFFVLLLKRSRNRYGEALSGAVPLEYASSLGVAGELRAISDKGNAAIT